MTKRKAENKNEIVAWLRVNHQKSILREIRIPKDPVTTKPIELYKETGYTPIPNAILAIVPNLQITATEIRVLMVIIHKCLRFKSLRDIQTAFKTKLFIEDYFTIEEKEILAPLIMTKESFNRSINKLVKLNIIRIAQREKGDFKKRLLEKEKIIFNPFIDQWKNEYTNGSDETIKKNNKRYKRFVRKLCYQAIGTDEMELQLYDSEFNSKEKELDEDDLRELENLKNWN